MRAFIETGQVSAKKNCSSTSGRGHAIAGQPTFIIGRNLATGAHGNIATVVNK